MLNKWERARYIIDAKKSVDSIIYISDNVNHLKHLDLKKRCDILRNEFYIKLCVVLDDVFGRKKTDICSKNQIIKSIYYERDKNSAHKDVNYKPFKASSFDELIKELKKQIREVKKVCKEYLPKELTLDFVSHDKELFRLVNGITYQIEEEIKKRKHPNYNPKNSIKTEQDNAGKNHFVFSDTEEIRDIPTEERNNYAVLMDAGLNLSEMLQNMQDSFIQINVLHSKNMWVSYNKSAIDDFEYMRKNGLLGKYDIPQVPPLTCYNYWKANNSSTRKDKHE